VEKIYRAVAVGLLVLLLAVSGFFAVRYARDVGQLRSDLDAVKERNRQLEYAATESAGILDGIHLRLEHAQSEIAGATDTIQRIRILVSTIEAISLELRKQPAVSP